MKVVPGMLKSLESLALSGRLTRLPSMFPVLLTGLLLGMASLANADSTTILTTVPAAENAIQTTDGRLFVSGSDGLYLVDAATKIRTKVPVALSASGAPTTATKCYFTGLTQYQQFLYAACTPDVNSNSVPRYVLVMDLGMTAQMRAFYSSTEPGIFNGMGSDSSGNLYIANYGRTMPSSAGKIVKLTLAAYDRVASKSDWLKVQGHVNGVKVADNAVYYTEDNLFGIGTNYFKKAAITASGSAGTPVKIYSTTDYLDDFVLVYGGAVITTAKSSFGSVTGNLIHLNEAGGVQHSAKFAGWQPTALAFLKTPTWGELLVTELKGSRVFVFSQAWNLNPRN